MKLENLNKDKRKNFRKLVKNSYFLKDDRLYYKYKKNNNEIKNKKIPYKYEVDTIFFNAHIENYHFNFDKAKEKLYEGEFYFEGITSKLKDYINSCPYCLSKNSLIKVDFPEYPIIDEGPHYEYQIDLWYLSDDIIMETEYKYIVDIIDHFSKWLWSYPINEKTAFQCLLCLKKYIYSFGSPKIIHSDNGKEFKNSFFREFCELNDIKQIFSTPYNPQSHGAIEACHKEVQRIINSIYYCKTNKTEFSLENALLVAINEHNNKIHSTTLFRPKDIRDTTDPIIINKIKENMKKKITKSLKSKNLYLLEKDDLILISDNILIDKKSKKDKINILIKDKSNSFGEFKIPGKFIKYDSNKKVLILAVVNFKNLIKKGKEYLIDYNLIREVSKEVFDYFINDILNI